MESATQVGVKFSVVCIPEDCKTVHQVLDSRAYLLRRVHVVNGLSRIEDILLLDPC